MSHFQTDELFFSERPEISIAPEKLKVFTSADTLAFGAAAAISRTLQRSIADLSPHQRYVEVAIAGGFVATTVLPALKNYVEDIDWSKIRFWWVDERFVSSGHKDRNDNEARVAFLDSVPDAVVQPMPSDEGQGLSTACTDFSLLWEREMGAKSLDLVLLGMGPDGHIASLFPGHEWAKLGEGSPDILRENDSPKPPAKRLSLSAPVIMSAKEIFLLAAGAAKANALGGAFGGAPAVSYPVGVLCLNENVLARTHWFIDEAASSKLSKSHD